MPFQGPRRHGMSVACLIAAHVASAGDDVPWAPLLVQVLLAVIMTRHVPSDQVPLQQRPQVFDKEVCRAMGTGGPYRVMPPDPQVVGCRLCELLLKPPPVLCGCGSGNDAGGRTWMLVVVFLAAFLAARWRWRSGQHLRVDKDDLQETPVGRSKTQTCTLNIATGSSQTGANGVEVWEKYKTLPPKTLCDGGPNESNRQGISEMGQQNRKMGTEWVQPCYSIGIPEKIQSEKLWAVQACPGH